jgi:hypothetical protein
LVCASRWLGATLRTSSTGWSIDLLQWQSPFQAVALAGSRVLMSWQPRYSEPAGEMGGTGCPVLAVHGIAER